MDRQHAPQRPTRSHRLTSTNPSPRPNSKEALIPYEPSQQSTPPQRSVFRSSSDVHAAHTGDQEHGPIRPGSRAAADLDPIDNVPDRRAGAQLSATTDPAGNLRPVRSRASHRGPAIDEAGPSAAELSGSVAAGRNRIGGAGLSTTTAAKARCATPVTERCLHSRIVPAETVVLSGGVESASLDSSLAPIGHR